MNKTRIDWGVGQLWTWNPITGCKRNCLFCYARRIHERFYKTPFTDIVVHKERFLETVRVDTPRTIFVGSMSDCQYWEKKDFELILTACKLCPQHTFMFLTKHAPSYYAIDFPSNTMQGLTITGGHDDSFWVNELAERCDRPFLSIEPLMGKINFKIPEKYERVIVGAMTGPKAMRVDRSWVDSIKANCPSNKLFFKDTITHE